MPIKYEFSETIEIAEEDKYKPGAEDEEEKSFQERNAEIKRLVYPIDDNNRYGAYIDFKVMKIIPPTAKGGETKASFQFLASGEMKARQQNARYLNNLKRNDPEQYEKEGGDEAMAENEEAYQVALNKRNEENDQAVKEFFKDAEYSDRTVEWTEQAVKLYLPVAFNQADALTISGTELGPLGAAAFETMSSGKGLASGFIDAFSQGAKSVFDLVTGNLTGAQATLASQRFTAKMLPSEANEAFKIATAVTVNPNLRSTFKGTNLREYSFSFKFIASSSKEAREVEKIIKTFRVAAYPESIPVGPVSAGYKFPNLFDISVYYEQDDEILTFDEEGNEKVEKFTKRKRIGNKLKHCYLRSVNTTYNPSVMAFHTDGQPVEIDLTLSFVEEVTIDRQDVEAGY